MALATKPKPSASHKKRVGKHHKTTKHYMKAYWPYIPISAIVSLGFIVNILLGSAGSVLGSQSDLSASSLLISTNQARASAEELPLHPNPQLSAAAQAKADDMVARNYWSHDTPDGKQPWTFVAATGYNYQTAGENLAYGFADAGDVLKGWMSSTEHRANVLNIGYKDVGFGVASSPDFNGTGPEVVVVAMYAQPNSDAVSNISFRVKHQPKESSVLGANIDSSSRPVSRVQLLTQDAAPWSVAATSVLAIAAMLLFMLRHGRSWHRVLARGELFVVTHPWFDVFLVSCGTVGFILTRISGFIS